MRLRTGEALVFSPTAHLTVGVPNTDSLASGLSAIRPLGNGFAKVKVRRRITADGGKSITADQASGGEPAASAVADEIPMFVVEAKKPATKEKVKAKPTKKAPKPKNSLGETEVEDLMPHVLPHLYEILPPILHKAHPHSSHLPTKTARKAQHALEKRLGLFVNHIHKYPPLSDQFQRIIEQPIVSLFLDCDLIPSVVLLVWPGDH